MEKPIRDNWDIHFDKVREILERDFAYSLMNNTKWMEVVDVLDAIPVATRIKRIFDPAPRDWGKLSGGTNSWLPHPFVNESHPDLVVHIEWMEIQPFERITEDSTSLKIDHSQILEERLRALNIPFFWHDGVIRIVGHQRKA